MGKQKFKLSKKHEYLINQIEKIPTMDEIKYSSMFRDYSSGVFTDFRYNTEDVLLLAIENLTKGTQLEVIGTELSNRARKVFDYYCDNVN